MAEHRLIDANALCDELKNELNRHDPDLLGSRVITLFMEMISEYPTIDPETLPIVQELKEKLEHVTAERDAAIKDRKELADFGLTTCEQFCFGDRKHDIPPCEWNRFGRCKLRE